MRSRIRAKLNSLDLDEPSISKSQIRQSVLTAGLPILLLLVLFALWNDVSNDAAPLRTVLHGLDALYLCSLAVLVWKGGIEQGRTVSHIMMSAALGTGCAFACLAGSPPILLTAFALHLLASIVSAGVLTSRRLLVATSCLAIAELAFLPLLLPKVPAAQLQEFLPLHSNIIALAVALFAASWLLRTMLDWGLERIRDERKVHKDLALSLEQLVRERTCELESAKVAAENAALARRDILQCMSEEIRTPLHSILGMAELSIQEQNPSAVQERIGLVVEAGNHLLEVIANILEFSRIQDQDIAFRYETVDLPALLSDILRGAEAFACTKGLELALWVAPSFPKHVQVDVLRLRQILSSYLDLSIRITRKGEVRLTTELCDNRITFQIQDTGGGITKSQARHILEHWQEELRSSPRLDRTDLSLLISKTLTERMGGTLDIHSLSGIGTTFVVKLPLLPAPDPPSANDSSASGAPADCLSGLRVLIADDNAINRKILEALLSKQGCTVYTAEHGRMALALLSRQPCDLILMDVQMPVMDGIEAVRILRGWSESNSDILREASATAVIALTASSDPETLSSCLEAGIDDILTKPFRSTRVREILERWAPSSATVRGSEEHSGNGP